MGFDSHKCFAEVHKDKNMEGVIGIKVQLLDVVVPEKTFEEVASRNC
jgi:hypothetical protein